jgi:hypothetical protein
MARQRADEPEATNEAEFVHLIAGLRQRSSELASLGNQQSTSAAPEPATNSPQRAA